MTDQCLAEDDRPDSPHIGTCICRQRRYHTGQHGCSVCGWRWIGSPPYEKYQDGDEDD